MDPKHDEQLCARYPNLYRDRHASPRSTCMCWGFTCGDGWFDLVDQLSAKLEAAVVQLKDAGTPEEQLPVAAQLKEKFGGLRLYMDNAADEMQSWIAEAEARSFTVCEQCGAPGVVRTGGWIRTLCDACHAKRNPDDAE